MRRPSVAFILIISLLSSLMACPILAGPIEDSRKAYRGGDYKTAFQLIKPEAEKGDAVAQFILGYMYDEGKGVPKDYDEAVKWYSRAAKQGNKEARHNLGLLGDQDQVSKDRAEKEKWHRGATEPQSAAAPPNLRLMEDRTEKEKWHRGATEPQSAAAPPNLRLMEDRTEKEKWHRGATEPQSAAAPPNLRLMEDRTEKEKWHRGATEPQNAAAPPNLRLMEDRTEKEKWHRGATEPQSAAAPPNLVLMDNQAQVSKGRAGMEKWHRGAE